MTRRRTRAPVTYLSLMLPLDLFRRVKDAAHDQRVSMSEFVRSAIRATIFRQREKMPPPVPDRAAGEGGPPPL